MIWNGTWSSRLSLVPSWCLHCSLLSSSCVWCTLTKRIADVNKVTMETETGWCTMTTEVEVAILVSPTVQVLVLVTKFCQSKGQTIGQCIGTMVHIPCFFEVKGFNYNYVVAQKKRLWQERETHANPNLVHVFYIWSSTVTINPNVNF